MKTRAKGSAVIGCGVCVGGGSSILTKLLVIFLSFMWWKTCGNMKTFTSDVIVLWLYPGWCLSWCFLFLHTSEISSLLCSLSWMHLLAVKAILFARCVFMAKSRSNVMNKSWHRHGIFLLFACTAFGKTFVYSSLRFLAANLQNLLAHLSSLHRTRAPEHNSSCGHSPHPRSISDRISESRRPDWLLPPPAHVRQREENLRR